MEQQCVYTIKNIRTGDQYIGSTVSLRFRRNQHLSKLRRNKGAHPRLQANWNEFGEAAFEFQILEIVQNPSELKDREQVWIDRLKPSLNTAPGSRSDGRMRWESIRRRNIEAGTTSHFYRHYLLTDPSGSQMCTDNLNQFAIYFGLDISLLFGVANGRARSHKGWRCEYMDRPSKTLSSVPKRKKSKIHIGYLLTDPKGVQMCTNNISEFCTAFKLTRENLLKVARGLRKTCQGWKCEFIDSVD